MKLVTRTILGSNRHKLATGNRYTRQGRRYKMLNIERKIGQPEKHCVQRQIAAFPAGDKNVEVYSGLRTDMWNFLTSNQPNMYIVLYIAFNHVTINGQC